VPKLSSSCPKVRCWLHGVRLGCGLGWFAAPKFPLCDGFGWVGLKKLDPRTTPSHNEAIAWVVASFDKW